MDYFINTLKKIRPYITGIMIGSLFLIDQQHIKWKIILMCILGSLFIIEASVMSYKNKKITNSTDIIFGITLIIFPVFNLMNYMLYVLILLVILVIFEIFSKLKLK
jgi:phosphatidylserine synthase